MNDDRTSSVTLLIARRFSRGLRTGLARFTTVAAIVSVAIGCLALILAISILNGYEEQIISTASRTMAHIEIQPLDPSIGIPSDLVAQLQELPGVRAVETVVTKEALARSGGAGVEGVMLLGASPSHLRTLAGADELPTRPGAAEGLPPAWMGRESARLLGCGVGDTVVIYTSRDGQQVPAILAVHVAGLIHTGMHTVDASLVAMHHADIERALGPSSKTILLTLDNPLQASAIGMRVQQIVPSTMFVRTWQDRFQAVASWIELQKRPIPVVLGLMSLVAMFTVASTLLVAVVEKTRSIAILLTLGMRPSAVLRVIALRGLVLSATGALIGAALAWILAVVQQTWEPIALDGAVYFVTALPVSLDPLPYLVVPAIAIGLSVVASTAPALLIRRIQPVRTLRFS